MNSMQRIRNLKCELHYLEEACRKWCTEEGLEFTTGARLAHHLFHLRYSNPPPYIYLLFDQFFDNSLADRLPRPSRDEAAWRAMSEWRHPETNLNLLQLAIVFNDYTLQQYLWQPMLLQEQDYRDDSSQLVNHPLHLLYRLREISDINLDYIRDELFYEEGWINLTPSKVLKLTGTQSNVSASGPSNASVLESHIRSPFQRALEERMFHSTTSADHRLFRQPEPIRMAQLYDWINVLSVVVKLSGPQAQPSTVELIWAIATSTTSAQRGCLFGLNYFLNIPQTHYLELLILLCQCTFSVTDAKLREERLNHLPQFFWKFSAEQNVQIEKAVRFLSTNTLEKIIRLLQMEEARRSQHALGCPAPLASEVLKDQLGCKSLQDLCVLTILEAVRGDTRKVWSLEQLPEPVKQLFHIPFQETYEELKARE